MQDVGAHLGVTNKLVYADGVPIRRVALGAHSAVRDLYDADSVQNLTAWSLRKHASARQEDPMHSLVLMSPEDAMLLGADRRKRLPIGSGAGQYGVGSADPGSLIDLMVGGNNAGSAPDFAVTSGVEVSSLETSVQSVDVSTKDVNAVVTQDTGHSSVTRSSEECYTSERRPAVHEDNEPTHVSKRARHGAGVVREIALQPALAPRRETMTSDTTAGIGSYGGEGVEGAGPQDVREIMQKMKAEERKIRNRESAHRSNLKKKKKREEIRVELDEAQDKVHELREKEIGLRQENLRLRRALKGDSPGG